MSAHGRRLLLTLAFIYIGGLGWVPMGVLWLNRWLGSHPIEFHPWAYPLVMTFCVLSGVIGTLWYQELSR